MQQVKYLLILAVTLLMINSLNPAGAKAESVSVTVKVLPRIIMAVDSEYRVTVKSNVPYSLMTSQGIIRGEPGIHSYSLQENPILLSD